MWLYSYGAVVLYILMKPQLFIFLWIISVFISALYSYGVSFFLLYIYGSSVYLYSYGAAMCDILMEHTVFKFPQSISLFIF